MPAKRRATASSSRASGPVPRVSKQSKLAKEHNLSPAQENEIREAFGLFAQPAKDEKEGVLPIRDVKKALIALGFPPTSAELKDFISILDPEDEGVAYFAHFVAICALKMHASKHDTEMRDREVEEAFHLFTNGTDGPISLRDLRRVAKALGEEVSEELLRNMILEANGGAGVSRGVGREDFEEVMRRAGVWP